MSDKLKDFKFDTSEYIIAPTKRKEKTKMKNILEITLRSLTALSAIIGLFVFSVSVTQPGQIIIATLIESSVMLVPTTLLYILSRVFKD